MKQRIMLFLLVLSISALAAGGCAKKEAVKSDGAITSGSSQYDGGRSGTETPRGQTIAPADTSQRGGTFSDSDVSQSDFETAYFDYDKSNLRQDTRDALSRNAAVLKNKKNVKVRLEGHCDERGSAEYNLALGERRAKSALNYLLTLGISADRLSITSYGKEKPAVDGQDENAWSKNRRVEFIVVR